jgi:hypothetical protein
MARSIAQIKQENTCIKRTGSLLWRNRGPWRTHNPDIEHNEVVAMTMHDPLWTAGARVRERAEAYAAERQLRHHLRRQTTWSRVEVGIGTILIALGEWTRALGCRLADACGCAEASVRTGSVAGGR